MIRFYWYKQNYNFGDILNVLLFRDVFGVKFKWAKTKKADCIAIGSILDMLVGKKMTPGKWLYKKVRGPIKIWGSGFITPWRPSKNVLLRDVEIYALRGKTSLKRMQEYTGKKLEHVVLGDPGLLASRLLDIKNIEKKYELGIIPHFTEKGTPLITNIDVKNSIVIDIQQPVEITLMQIAQCKNILSSAMHGLIVADAFGIPNARIELSDKMIGGDYKFIDYYSAFGVEMPEKIIITPDTKITDISFIKDKYQIKPEWVEDICQKLLNVFPYKN